ncbi:hypothetical protein CMI37_08510 [Candidatus Pacearchaeota archaeon]|nr:hypothetical protein [Candidatus Pacearchaeota archaeon]|tara:strand:+ start:6672 stop:7553 length:882 start_codon:yes stop_codon:yes gene_type:complete
MKTALFSRKQSGGVFSIEDQTLSTGDRWFVDSNTGTDGAGYGQNPDKPVATLDYAIGLATTNKGDIIFVMPGHTETLTSKVDVDKADINIIGLGNGNHRPQFTVNANIDGIDVGAANVRITNLYFNEGTNANTSRINIGAAFCIIEDCHFDCGANDLESITIEDEGDDCTIRSCTWRVTADGPDAAIEIEHADTVRLIIEDCFFDGGSDANGWDVGAINSGVAHTLCLIRRNVSLYGPGIIFSAGATGIIALNILGEGTLASMLDPGSCMCFENYEADAVDQSARLIPTVVAS